MKTHHKLLTFDRNWFCERWRVQRCGASRARGEGAGFCAQRGQPRLCHGHDERHALAARNRMRWKVRRLRCWLEMVNGAGLLHGRGDPGAKVKLRW